MLIIAVPKSASTSLAVTLAAAHGRTWVKPQVPAKPAAPGYEAMGKLNPCCGVWSADELRSLALDNRVHRKHVPPLPGHVAALEDVPVVLLLRRSRGVMEAYDRAKATDIRPYPQTGQDAAQVGQEVSRFVLNWLRHLRKINACYVTYDELTSSPQQTLRRVSQHLGLSVDVSAPLAKELYTRDRLEQACLKKQS